LSAAPRNAEKEAVTGRVDARPEVLQMQSHRGILISRIPAEGFAGAILAMAIPVLVLVAVPQLRIVAACALVGGVLLAPLLRMRTPR
jgi:hypothetical protein